MSDYKINDKVVYPAHGVGVITAIETQTVAGQEVSVYVVYFERERMNLRIPVKRALTAKLRKLATREIVKEAICVLKGKAKPAKGMCSKRAQECEAKINSGSIVSIAEVVRDLHKNSTNPDRSYSEIMIYKSALNRLAGEYAAINEIDCMKAEEFVVDLLSEREAA